MENPLQRLTEEQIEAIGREFDELHDEVKADLGDRDAAYIRGIIALHRRLGLIGRALLVGSRYKPAFVAGTATLSLAKILENMEIGHNVLHGQWDWMNDPVINSSAWDWDSASSAAAWKHSHNFIHHTYTNIRGKDRDLGYEIMRIDPHQPWHPVYLLQPFYNLLLMAFFEWGVAFHDLDIDAIRAGEKSKEELREELKGIVAQGAAADPEGLRLLARAQRRADDRDRVRRLPARAGSRRARLLARLRREPEPRFDALAAARRTFLATLTADAAANIVRNLWAHGIIFCGHFPDQTYTFSQEETAGRDARRASTCASCSARPTSRAARCFTSSAATSATRSSTTSTRTCRAPATARSRRACARSARATSCPTTPARCGSSGAWCSARSSGSPSRAASRGRSPARTPARRSAPPASASSRRPGLAEDVLGRVDELEPLGHARDLEDALNRRRAAHEHQPALVVGQAPAGEHDRPQAAGVEEVERAQIERHDVDAGLVREALQLGLERRPSRAGRARRAASTIASAPRTYGLEAEPRHARKRKRTARRGGWGNGQVAPHRLLGTRASPAGGPAAASRTSRRGRARGRAGGARAHPRARRSRRPGRTSGSARIRTATCRRRASTPPGASSTATTTPGAPAATRRSSTT